MTLFNAWKNHKRKTVQGKNLVWILALGLTIGWKRREWILLRSVTRTTAISLSSKASLSMVTMNFVHSASTSIAGSTRTPPWCLKESGSTKHKSQMTSSGKSVQKLSKNSWVNSGANSMLSRTLTIVDTVVLLWVQTSLYSLPAFLISLIMWTGATCGAFCSIMSSKENSASTNSLNPSGKCSLRKSTKARFFS